MKTKWNWIIILSMLLGLVFTKPQQLALAQVLATADFTFQSSPNPSNYGQEVTFTLSATGSDPTYPPFGYVAFFDNGVTIPGCTIVPLNYSSGPEAGRPAVCTTSSLAVGTHTITAEFDSLIKDNYADAVLTLADGQIVNDALPLTIIPSRLLDAMLTIYYEIPLTAYYSNGSECTNCTWSATLGSLPDGIGIGGYTGVLHGTPTTVGAYTFTIVAEDGNGARGTQAYTWNVTKVKSVVDVGISSTYVGSTMPTTLGATARNPNPYYSPRPNGKMSFSVNGVPVPGCSGENALSTNFDGAAYCTSYLPTGLAAGSYEIKAEFTPDSTSSELYLSATGTGTLQVNSPQAIVSGRVFMDDNQNGVIDETEVAQGTWHVDLNQDCDDVLEGDVVTYDLTGAFTFYPVPIDNHTYCLSVNLSSYPGYIQTTPYDNLTLSGDQYFEIGIYYPHITILPNLEYLPTGSIGTYYEQTFQILGGSEDYTTIEVTSELPQGLSFDLNTLTLSGTPTAGGAGMLQIYVVDSEGISAERTYMVVIKAEGEFSLTSSSNPSGLGEAVTFTLTGSGNAVDPQFGTAVPPYGIVTFFDGDEPIPGCEETILNVDLELLEIGNYPATCTTSGLTEGQHTIKAFFTFEDGVYSDATRTLTQMVGIEPSLAIMTETLSNAEYQTPYSLQLAASGGTEPYFFSLIGGALPSGITLSSDGLLSGFADYPAAPGTYPITIQVVDANEVTTSRDYDFVLGKGVPTVTTRTDANIFWSRPFAVSAEVLKQISESSYAVLDGTVAFFIDDIPVPGCGAVTEMNGYYYCPSVVMDLDVNIEHTVKASFTPTGWYANYYTAGSGSGEFTVQPSLANFPGEVFMDANQNGVYDEGENRINESGWTVNLDQGCDGTADYTVQTLTGAFYFPNIPVSGQCHRFTVDAAPGYQQTTQLADFYPGPGTAPFLEVGFYYPTIIISPSTYELPSGTIGVEYSQAFSASGGTAPYTYSIDWNRSTLPNGLTLSPDGVLSGTPTSSGNYTFTVRVEDATHAINLKSYNLSIELVKVDGSFTFTSSSNPSTLGEAVTFTVSATGAAETPDGVFPPIGVVTFFADGNEIAGCSNLYLNILFVENGSPIIGNYPVTCTTAALGEGSHEITATYYDLMGAYNEPSLTLTQVVSAPVSADLTIDNIDSKDPVKPGTKMVYTLTVSNQGPNSAENVIVTDKLDVNTTYVSVAAPKGWTCSFATNSGTVTCSSESLASGSSAIIKITVIVNKTAKPGKELVNNAFVSSATFDPDLSNNTVVQKTMVIK